MKNMYAVMNSYSNSFYLATTQMIDAHSVTSGPHYVELNWCRPKFQPERYQLNYVCTMKPTCTPGHAENNYVMIKIQNLSSDSTSITIPDIRSSSICMLILLAVYNPASIDSGIAITGTTLHEDPRKINPDPKNPRDAQTQGTAITETTSNEDPSKLNPG